MAIKLSWRLKVWRTRLHTKLFQLSWAHFNLAKTYAVVSRYSQGDKLVYVETWYPTFKTSVKCYVTLLPKMYTKWADNFLQAQTIKQGQSQSRVQMCVSFLLTRHFLNSSYTDHSWNTLTGRGGDDQRIHICKPNKERWIGISHILTWRNTQILKPSSSRVLADDPLILFMYPNVF